MLQTVALSNGTYIGRSSSMTDRGFKYTHDGETSKMMPSRRTFNLLKASRAIGLGLRRTFTSASSVGI